MTRPHDMDTTTLKHAANEAWLHATDPDAALRIGMREWADRQMAALRFMPALIARISELETLNDSGTYITIKAVDAEGGQIIKALRETMGPDSGLQQAS